jgi:hypothetical protein
MLVERKFFGTPDGYVAVDWAKPIEALVLEPHEAHCIADVLLKLSEKAVHGRPSKFHGGAPDVRMKVQGRYACVHFGQALQVWHFTKTEASQIGHGLRDLAYKAERNERGLLPTKHDVDRMEEALVGEGGHRIIQHAPGAPTVPDSGGGLRVVPQGSFLSRLIRQVWR